MKLLIFIFEVFMYLQSVVLPANIQLSFLLTIFLYWKLAIQMFSEVL